MSVNIKRKNVALKEIMCSKYGQTKVESDLIVPDTKPDIAKVLQICGRAVITQKTVQQDKAYIQGIVYLTVVYVPEEGGGVKSMFFSLDFSHVMEAKGAESGNHIWAETDIEEIDYSVVNSRKLSVKCSVGIDTKISRTKEAKLPSGIEGESSVQARHEGIKLSCASAEEEQDFRFRERIEVPSGKPHIGEIIKFRARCNPSEVKYSDGRIIASGDMEISVLYSAAEDLSINSIDETLPFNETIEGMTLPEGDCEANYVVKNAEFEVEEDADDSRRFINVDITVCGIFRTTENIEESVISDAFDTQNPVKLTKSAYNIESIIDKSTTQIAHKESVAIPDYMPGIYRMCDCSGEARVTGISIENGRINVDGEILSNSIYLSSEEGNPVSGLSHVSSFSQSVDMPYSDKDSICEAKVELDHIGYSINSDRSLEFRFIVILSVTVLRGESLEIIDDIEIDENSDGKVLPSATIYFPEDGETVWDIAKRYMATPEAIMKENNLEGDTLRKGQKICIFR